MPASAVSRRSFLSASAATLAASASVLADPASAAAQNVGVKPADLPDLTIKEVKVYVINHTPTRPANSANPARPPATEQVASIVTNSGIEGNYSLDQRYFHPNWSNLGWLEYAKRTLPGKSVLDLPRLTSQWEPDLRRQGQLSYASAIDNCCWDILGKAVNLPVYRILGAYRDKVMAYGSTQHHTKIEEFVDEALRCKAAGMKAYKIHPPGGTAPNLDDYKVDMELCKAIRQAVGELSPGDLHAIAHVERLTGRGVVTQREQRRIDQVLDVAEAGDRPTSSDEDHVSASDRARDLADDVPGAGSVDGRRAQDHGMEAGQRFHAADLLLGFELRLGVPVAESVRNVLLAEFTDAGVAVDIGGAEVDEPSHGGLDGCRQQVSRALDVGTEDLLSRRPVGNQRAAVEHAAAAVGGLRE